MEVVGRTSLIKRKLVLTKEIIHKLHIAKTKKKKDRTNGRRKKACELIFFFFIWELNFLPRF